MTVDKKRYPNNWKEIALTIKEKANWKCQCCNRPCYKPNEKPKGISRSERAI